VRRSFKRRPDSIRRVVPESRSTSLALKRGIDVIVSSALLVLLSPLLVAIAVAIKLTSPGPIFYRWKVVGQGGRPFVGYKLRTMIANADDLKVAMMARNEVSGPIFKIRADPRITPIGRALRKYSLDELPQLWSVLKGDMSLVGPRPPLQTEYSHFATSTSEFGWIWSTSTTGRSGST
jgi:lipopolysaccharide/colanic/teichoic acid biosynthesis glycosyltransferase